MRLGMLKEVDWNYIAASLAGETAETQATFLKAFEKECLTWGTHYQVELQLAGVNGKLTEEEIEVLSMLTYQEEAGK